MDDKKVQNEGLDVTEPVAEETPAVESAEVVEEAAVNTEAEVVDTTVMPKVEFNAEVQGETVVVVKKEKKKEGLAVASMVCGICGAVFGLLELCCCCWPLSVIASICAIVFALVDRSKKGSFNGKTITGLVCGIVGVVAPIVLIAIEFVVTFNGDFSAFSEEFWNAYYEGMEQYQ